MGHLRLSLSVYYSCELPYRYAVRLTLKWKLINMTVQDYLLKFRKISSLESLEKLFDHLNYTLTDNQEIINMYRAADHRRAELVSGGRLFNVGEVPKTVWRYVL
ncbi:hemolysin expression modulating family protein [Enterobacter sp. 638]|nr:hemolysin expression modulating family protein [Enterobacter sp. 638]